MVTGRNSTAPLILSTTHTAGRVPCWKMALSGTSANTPGSGLDSISEAVMPSPMKVGGSITLNRAG